MTRLLLFDIDGTLIRSGGAGEKAFGRVFAEVFGVPDANRGVKFAGRTDLAIVREVFERQGIAPSVENFQRFLDNYPPRLQHFLRTLSGATLPGVRELLAGLRTMPQAPMLGLLTGNIRRGAELKLSHYELWNHFAMGAFADDAELRNDVAATALAEGRRLLGDELRPAELLVIGDTPSDIVCARHIGARVLAVATGQFRAEELAAHQPDRLVDTLTKITAESLCE